VTNTELGYLRYSCHRRGIYTDDVAVTSRENSLI